jgi:hypothetical protein
VQSGDAAKCRKVNSTRPARIRRYSSATGSFTFKTSSPSAHTSSGSGRIFAPAAMNSSSGIWEPTPAVAST